MSFEIDSTENMFNQVIGELRDLESAVDWKSVISVLPSTPQDPDVKVELSLNPEFTIQIRISPFLSVTVVKMLSEEMFNRLSDQQIVAVNTFLGNKELFHRVCLHGSGEVSKFFIH